MLGRSWCGTRSMGDGMAMLPAICTVIRAVFAGIPAVVSHGSCGKLPAVRSKEEVLSRNAGTRETSYSPWASANEINEKTKFCSTVQTGDGRNFASETPREETQLHHACRCGPDPASAPLAPAFQCWGVATVAALAKFLPVKRPPWDLAKRRL